MTVTCSYGGAPGRARTALEAGTRAALPVGAWAALPDGE